MQKPRILIVDDEEGARESLRFILKSLYDVHVVKDGASALEAIARQAPFALVTLDMRLPGMSGLELLCKILQQTPGTGAICVTAVNDARTAVQAMKMGAADYLTKPFDANEIRLVVDRVLKLQQLEREQGRSSQRPSPVPTFENILGSSPAMQRIYSLMQRLLPTDTTVLICGETGTGKELVARALHQHGPRQQGPFVAVHCASIPSELLESELFGYEKGAFTGAMQQRLGMFESAGGGTLFLDEIGEMPLATQTKLLRAIQEREIRRLGGKELIRVNVRLVCATNRNLPEGVRHGTFREDLFYRINVVPLTLPPLRDRAEDIPLLLTHFAGRIASELNRSLPRFSASALEMAVAYPWPGNVRELEHVVERLLVSYETALLDGEHLAACLASTSAPAVGFAAGGCQGIPAAVTRVTAPEGEGAGVDLTQLTDELERKAIEEALRRSGGVVTQAARTLKITRRMLRYRMEKFGIAVGMMDEK